MVLQILWDSVEIMGKITLSANKDGLISSFPVCLFIFGCAESLLHRLFSSYGERGCSLAAGPGSLLAVASLVAGHKL